VAEKIVERLRKPEDGKWRRRGCLRIGQTLPRDVAKRNKNPGW
jgi:hypothetical protein